MILEISKRFCVLLLPLIAVSCGGGGGGGSGGATEQTPALRVVLTSFADGAIDVDLATPIVVAFDTAVGTGITPSQVQLMRGSVAVPVVMETSGSGVVVKPATPLSVRTEYRLTIKAGARANNGAVLQADYVLNFKTMAIAMETKKLLSWGPEMAQSNVSAGDVNGDGRLDLVLSTPYANFVGGFEQGYTLSVYLQNADGSIALAQRTKHVAAREGAATRYSKPLVIDIDGDGAPEILISQEVWGDDEFSGLQVFKRGDDGQFRELPFRQSRYFRRLFAADVNGDGRLDLIGSFANTSSDSSSGFQVFLNTSSGLVALAPVDMPEGWSAREYAVGDLDRDGSAEILVSASTTLNGTFLPRPVRWIFSRQADGQYARNSALTQAIEAVCADQTTCEKPAFIDIDGDGWLDLLFGSASPGGIVAYMRQPGAGFIAGASTMIALYSHILKIADLDNDGLQDMLWVSNTSFNFVVAGLGQRRGHFEYSRAFELPNLPLSPPQEDAVVVADFNGDGRLDVIVSAYEGIVLMQQLK